MSTHFIYLCGFHGSISPSPAVSARPLFSTFFLLVAYCDQPECPLAYLSFPRKSGESTHNSLYPKLWVSDCVSLASHVYDLLDVTKESDWVLHWKLCVLSNKGWSCLLASVPRVTCEYILTWDDCRHMVVSQKTINGPTIWQSHIAPGHIHKGLAFLLWTLTHLCWLIAKEWNQLPCLTLCPLYSNPSFDMLWKW